MLSFDPAPAIRFRGAPLPSKITIEIPSRISIEDVTLDVTQDGVKDADGVLYDTESFARVSNPLKPALKRKYASAWNAWNQDETPHNKHRLEDVARVVRVKTDQLEALGYHVSRCQRKLAARRKFKKLGRGVIAQRCFEKAMLALFAEVTLRPGNAAAQAAQAHFEGVAGVTPVDAP